MNYTGQMQRHASENVYYANKHEI